VTAITDQDFTVIDRHEEAEAAQDVEGVVATFGPDAVLEPKPTGREFIGPAEIRVFYQDLFGAFPDLAPRLVHRYRDGAVVIDELVFSGTHAGPFMGIPATDRPVEVAASVVYEVRDGQLIREAAYWDVATMLVQMGILPPPGESAGEEQR